MKKIISILMMLGCLMTISAVAFASDKGDRVLVLCLGLLGGQWVFRVRKKP